MSKIPKASYKASIYSGVILGALAALCSFVEPNQGMGTYEIVLGSITTIFFIISCLLFVGGFENFWEIDPRKASYWKAHFPRIKRGLVYMFSAIFTASVINAIINSITT